uniref:CBS domain-containing protein n=1 Tax=Attheya septentrionalis TaxID=420275 RepID=A0A7S2XTM4_9STRA|mmetsp:Transcript_7483/g.13474  ORF Transcript_7483/g.13474 Transcript_7483/m.13474 type:complete len:206 (+) Transcript_7483:94-711(+)|eukprot:CAMPEP_0198287086 /NCGR_PEP_ID=MMETSP1449-20131203/6008_1 /TAXON_ID=420275 /ORGANISM="Attheya septentrionalis, Strain CCMP2084" /LENGTH=205 /DNA_ID=CAMNT_0043984985 /DNA_START=107 /DNA_END=724 /DNA_ORIENTATION=+
MFSGVAALIVRPGHCLARQRARSAIATPKCSIPRALVSHQQRNMGTVEESSSAKDAWKKSCFVKIDFTVPEESTAYDAVQKLAAFKVGCLITVDASGRLSGVVSERDIVSKVALLEKDLEMIKIKEISTKTDNLLTASRGDSVSLCMEKMLARDIRHLPLMDDDGKVIGMLSMKDCIKSVMDEREQMIQSLKNFAMGKGGHFVED